MCVKVIKVNSVVFFSSLVSTYKWNDILRPPPPGGLAGDG